MSTADRIRVMVVDDHPIMRSGLRDTLEASGRFEVVGGWRSGRRQGRHGQIASIGHTVAVDCGDTE